MRILQIVSVLFVAVILSSCMSKSTTGGDPYKDYGEGYLYSCNCGAQCTCNDVKTKPGDCSCGEPLKPGYILKQEGDTATLCDCGDGCKCALDPQNSNKCSCGKPVKKVNTKGLY